MLSLVWDQLCTVGLSFYRDYISRETDHQMIHVCMESVWIFETFVNKWSVDVLDMNHNFNIISSEN